MSFQYSRFYHTWLKRPCDIIFSLLLFICTSPIFIIVTILIKVASPSGSVFYAHQRIGRNHQPFACWKFRTMMPDADKKLVKYLETNPAMKEEFERDFKLKKDPRILPVIGHFLRFTSLDELPQIFNVLRGDMSMIGPRPITQAELPRYGEHVNTLLSVRPGITGLWQVSGRNDVSYNKRVELDMFYIMHINFFFDLQIALKTVLVILLHKGY